MTSKLQIREGAYYLDGRGKVCGPAVRYGDWFDIDGFSYTPTGYLMRSESKASLYHIVSEVTITPVVPPEPKRRMVWLALRKDGLVGGPYIHRDVAMTYLDIIACQRFELIEGVYDDE